MLEADHEEQQRLLEIAATDRAISAAEHRRKVLPELSMIAAGAERSIALRAAKVNAETEVADLDSDGRKLDTEIDQVRARAARDAALMSAGAGPAKDLSSLQHEIDSLVRRQATLEDRALELMERRESADAELARASREFDSARTEIAAAESRRDDQFADLDDELTRLAAARSAQVSTISADVLALYDRIRRTGKIAAAELRGAECQGCRLELDAVTLAEIRSAPPEQLARCAECGAILVRA